jgi:phage FluMu protein Com
MIGDALVDSLISSAKKNKAVDLRIPSSGFLAKKFPRCRHQNNGRLRSEHSRLLRASQVVAENCFGRLEERLRLEHHPLAAAKRPIIDAAVAILGEHTQILHMDLDEARLASPPQNAVIQRPGKKFWKNGNQIEAHRSC